MAYISWDSLKNPVADNSFKLSATHFENVGLRRTLDRKKKYPLSQGHFYLFFFYDNFRQIETDYHNLI